MFISRQTLKMALQDLQGTADHMIKIWFVLKAMGLTKTHPVVVDTSNSNDALKRLFRSGSPDGRFCVPFADFGSRYRFMKSDAARSIIQTNIKKWMDGTVTGSDPTDFLHIRRLGNGYEVAETSSCPEGLGDGERGFGPGPNEAVQIPMLQFAVWVFAEEEIPDGMSDVGSYLRGKLRHELHLEATEESRVFVPGNMELHFASHPLSAREIFGICSGDEEGTRDCGSFARPDILAAIRTKPFVLLAGISGTGKSRMVRQLARGCCPRYKAETAEDHPLYDEQKPGNFEMVQVRPNWHDSTELLGYATRITEDGKPRYVLTDFVRFLAKAWLFPEVPFFVCLDEMNLAPVEQYFAEYLSVVETRRRDGVSRAIRTDVLVRFPPETAARAIGELLAPYEPAARGFAKAEVDALREAWTADGGIRIPPNLVVMGTVNMDETTFSFSRKVLDRAMSFELGGVDMKEGLETAPDAAFGSIPAEAAMASRLKPSEFYEECKELCDRAVAFLEGVNAALEGTPFQIAYRTRDEVLLYCVERTEGGAGLAQALDEAACMKILPRVEGDQKREGVLKALAEAVRSALDAAGDAGRACTKCTGKIGEMREQLREGGYTSFWTR